MVFLLTINAAIGYGTEASLFADKKQPEGKAQNCRDVPC